MIKVDSIPSFPGSKALFWTSALTDLALLYLLLPLWWALGVEQFIWAPALVVIAAKVWLLRGGFRDPGSISPRKIWRSLQPAARWMAVFLLIHLISGLFIVETFRYLTFTRNLLTFAAAGMLLVIIPWIVSGWQEIRRLSYALLAVMLVAGILGLLAALEIWQPSFKSLMGYLMPEWIAQTDYGGRIAQRFMGVYNWFIGLNWYFRVKAFFIFPPLYASALVITIPLAIFLFVQSRSRSRKWLLGALIALMLFNLVYTTGRTAIAGFLAGGAFYLLSFSSWRRWLRMAVLVGAITVFILALWNFDTTRQIAWNALFARGSGTVYSRVAIYRESIRGAIERPFFGWGTERDFIDQDFAYPAGSHNLYLGVLYKQGFIGLFLWMGVLILVWRGTAPPRDTQPDLSGDTRALVRFLQFGRWVLIAALVNGLTESLDLDASNFAMLWLILAMLVVARREVQVRTATIRPDQVAGKTNKINILDVGVSRFSVEDLHEYIAQQIEARGHTYIPNVNVYCLNLSYELAVLRKFLNEAEVVFCDGAGVRLGARLLGETPPPRITYADWMWQLAKFCETHGFSLFFVGARPGVARRAAVNLLGEFPGLKIRGTHHGYFNRSRGHPENEAVIAAINRSRADILITGLGMPLQETWLMENWDRIRAHVALTGGAAFDYVSGDLRRAPRWMTRSGLEWLGRLFIEPGRLWYRYLVGNPRFLWRVFMQRLGRMRPSQDLTKRYHQRPPRY